VIRNRMVHIFT